MFWNYWVTCERCLPHALLCAKWIEQEQMVFSEAAYLLNQAGLYLRDRARYEEAERLYVRALAICEEQLGERHPNTATSLNNLGLLYYNQGKNEEAERLYVRALAIYEQSLGKEHPSTRIVRRNYALMLRNMGRDADVDLLER